jgi:signal peptidase II
MPYVLLTLVLVALDQLVKYLVLQNIPLGAHVPFLPYLVELTYVQNTGAAFSMFSDHTWLLALVSLAISALLALAIWKNLFHHPIGKVTLTLLLAGALGNFLDRAFRGFVVDMFNVLFMNFAVFNVADVCVVVGGIGAAVYYLFLSDKLEPRSEKEQPHGNADADC